jgi:hypothetical protein
VQAAYRSGSLAAQQDLGVVKTANPLRDWFRRVLSGPYGETIVRTATQAGMGGLAGAAASQVYEGPSLAQAAGLGALSGGLGGMAVASAPRIQRALVKRLRG